ncbi:MAG: cytochrome c oxidase subunit II [Steroidobacteraceae bacterium]
MTRIRSAWLVLGSAWLLAGCEAPQSALWPLSDQSQAINRVWQVMVWTCTALYLLVLVALGLALWRRRRAVASEGQRHDAAMNRGLVAWAVLVVGFLTWFVALSYVQDRKLRGGDAALQVRITARQWWWKVEYLDKDPSAHFTTANELYLPRDRTARIELRSGDVIHSFWVPSLSGKEDLIPGRTNALWITPRANGRYRAQCAEFCGLQHAHMALDVVVETPAGFEAWRRDQLLPARAPPTASAAHGQRVFEQAACATCHMIRGTAAAGRLGPDLTHLASRKRIASGLLTLERQNLMAWIADPQHFKPGNQMPAVHLGPRDFAALVDYLMGLE